VVPTAHPEGAFHVGWVRQMFEHADTVLCLAHEEADLVASVHGCGDRVRLVPAPVEPIDPPARAAIDEALGRWGLDEGGYAIVVGRIDPAKGSDDAIRFAQHYQRRIDPAFRLVVVGPGGALERLDAVIPTGFVDDDTLVGLVAGAGVLLQPSYMESFSLILMEAWLLERPALIQGRSRVLAGHADRSGGGLTYEDYADFEVAMTALRRSPELVRTLGQRGRDYVRRTFSWDAVAPAFLEAIETTARAGQDRLARRRTAIS
jgi:glycosyltransferase involved in cell wall biosynthesis